ncbi:multiprotein-bridging factor 1c [Dendrobium catenatum]|uniref:multiprotein-bridging factor 1c n=1 Tax=Dendrobium catenatum TaxID=906689 RepID=UPI00109F43CE|nr:multiprotein-bridging factor 1c [Dendrobium catenatum]
MPVRPTGNITQDWDPVVLSRRKPKSADLKDPKVVNNAIRSGAEIETVKKFDAGSNKKGSSAASQPAMNARKLDEQTEPAALDRVSADLRLAIQKARLDKKMSQAELAKQILKRLETVVPWLGIVLAESRARCEVVDVNGKPYIYRNGKALEEEGDDSSKHWFDSHEMKKIQHNYYIWLADE